MPPPIHGVNAPRSLNDLSWRTCEGIDIGRDIIWKIEGRFRYPRWASLSSDWLGSAGPDWRKKEDKPARAWLSVLSTKVKFEPALPGGRPRRKSRDLTLRLWGSRADARARLRRELEDYGEKQGKLRSDPNRLPSQQFSGPCTWPSASQDQVEASIQIKFVSWWYLVAVLSSSINRRHYLSLHHIRWSMCGFCPDSVHVFFTPWRSRLIIQLRFFVSVCTPPTGSKMQWLPRLSSRRDQPFIEYFPTLSMRSEENQNEELFVILWCYNSIVCLLQIRTQIT